MGVNPGYKNTEIGVIPQDWSTRSLGKICDVRDGTHESPRFFVDGVPLVTSKNIINGRLDMENVSCISKTDAIEFDKRSKVNRNDIIMSMIGTIGNAALVKCEPDFCIKNVALLKTRDVESAFLIQLINSPNFQRYLEENLDGGIQKFISLGTLRKLSIALPVKTEQRAIAEVLGDVDAMLDSLDRLIAKKRDLRQAAMQQLLTGQTRLPGFSGGWEVKRLGELLAYEQPTNYLVSSSEYSDSFETPVLTAGKTFLLGFTNEINGIYRNLPAIIFDDFTTASKYVSFEFKAKSSAMKILKAKDSTANLEFIYLIMQTIEFKVSEHKRHWISEYQKIEIKYPDELERTAIAAALADMQAEITSLVDRRDKTATLKQGMMQELLTGRTRLV